MNLIQALEVLEPYKKAMKPEWHRSFWIVVCTHNHYGDTIMETVIYKDPISVLYWHRGESMINAKRADELFDATLLEAIRTYIAYLQGPKYYELNPS